MADLPPAQVVRGSPRPLMEALATSASEGRRQPPSALVDAIRTVGVVAHVRRRGGVKCGHLLLREAEVGSPEVVCQMLARTGADQDAGHAWLLGHPCERYLSERNPSGGSDPTYGVQDVPGLFTLCASIVGLQSPSRVLPESGVARWGLSAVLAG